MINDNSFLDEYKTRHRQYKFLPILYIIFSFNNIHNIVKLILEIIKYFSKFNYIF